MTRTRPYTKIPYKRFEKPLDLLQVNNMDEQQDPEAAFVVMKDITLNPAEVTTNIRQEKISNEQQTENEAPHVNKENYPAETTKAAMSMIKIKKPSKIKRKK